MTTKSTQDASQSPIFAYTAPFIIFILFICLAQVMEKWAPAPAGIWLAKPVYWLYPIQTLVCAGLLAWCWRKIEFRGIAYLSVIFAVGFFVFAIWTSPQFFHWATPRTDGFNPEVFPPGSLSYWATVLFRFLRLVIVVPLLEEIFWRGFLMRYLIDEDFIKVPFGTFRWSAFLITVAGFTLEHQPADYAAALICGIVYNSVACLTKSLGSCVFVHAVTNLFLGLYIMFTKQWGFW